MIRRCAWCRHGIDANDSPKGDGNPYTICALLPPAPTKAADGAATVWVRPSMVMRGWCGQFRLSLRRLFKNGA
jgi:hypothetical protein